MVHGVVNGPSLSPEQDARGRQMDKGGPDPIDRGMRGVRTRGR